MHIQANTNTIGVRVNTEQEQHAALSHTRIGYERDALRYGTGMLRRFGWLYYLLFMGWRLRHLRLDDFGVQRIRQASQKGPVAHFIEQKRTQWLLCWRQRTLGRTCRFFLWSSCVTVDQMYNTQVSCGF